MRDFLELIIKIITSDIFIGYGLFTLTYILISLIKKNGRLIERLDLAANRFIGFAGIIYFSCIITLISMSIVTVDDYQIRWAPLLQVFLWTIITQLLWIEKLRKIKLIRFAFSILLIVSFEIFVIVVTSLHRDYSLGGLFSELSPADIIIGLSSKAVIFCILAIIYSLVIDKLKELKAT